ncbi:MAG: hypothetical protein SFX73_12555 [Kofleriaceae bacterium]|nr:hypothetical protein [Kofleriaceae bacterium]
MAARNGVWVVITVVVAAAVAPAPASADCIDRLRPPVPLRGSVLAYRETARGEWPPRVLWWGTGSARITTLSPNMAWIDYAGEHGAELMVFART